MALKYQWYKNGSLISGATSATYTKSSAVEGDAGSYYCRVSNAFGSVNSNSATVTVYAHTLLLIQVDAEGNIVERTGNGTVTTNGTVIVDHTTTHDGYGSIHNTGGYTSITCDISMDDDFTVECWVYALSQTAVASAFEAFYATIEEAPWLYIRNGNPDNQTSFAINGQTCRDVTPRLDSSWHHLAIVHHGNKSGAFIDGQIIKWVDQTISSAFAIRTIWLGRNYYDDNVPYCWENIRISDVALYTANFTPPGRF